MFTCDASSFSSGELGHMYLRYGRILEIRQLDMSTTWPVFKAYNVSETRVFAMRQTYKISYWDKAKKFVGFQEF
jgi:hypothetical protein